MKKLLVLVMVALLAMGALAGTASAARIPNATGGDWEDVQVHNTASDPKNALVFRVPGGVEQYCNESPREFDINVRAFVAQWAHWEVDFGGWEWYVKKPGTYFGDCIAAHIQSNGHVTVSFEGFGNLVRVDPDPGGLPDTNKIIPTRFGYSVGNVTPLGWIAATEMDEFEVPFADNNGLHQGRNFKLWNEITVVDCNSPGFYAMSGTVILTLDNQPVWINPEGEFDMDYFNSNNGYIGVPGEGITG